MHTHKSQRGAALAASAVAASMLVIATPPATAAGPHRLELISLHCYSTEDNVGHDEAYMTVNGVKVWGTVDLIEGGWSETMPTVHFDRKADVRLYDADTGAFWDKDDLLGTLNVRSSQANQGTQDFDFTKNGANYKLYYRVLNG